MYSTRYVPTQRNCSYTNTSGPTPPDIKMAYNVSPGVLPSAFGKSSAEGMYAPAHISRSRESAIYVEPDRVKSVGSDGSVARKLKAFEQKQARVEKEVEAARVAEELAQAKGSASEQGSGRNASSPIPPQTQRASSEPWSGLNPQSDEAWVAKDPMAISCILNSSRGTRSV